VSPLVRSATFRFPDTAAFAEVGLERRPGYFYTRYDNPTLRSVEDRIASLEGTERALVFASGLAAISTALLAHLRGGDRLVATRDLYGGTQHVFSLLERFGVRVALVPVGEEAALEREVARGARLVYTETPTNPLLRIVDLERVAGIAHAAGALLAVDSTFATPVNSRPCARGADLVLHSATKYLGGHADLLGGAVAGRREALEPVERARRVLGGVMDPDGAWLLERSLKTLSLRVARANENAMKLATFLASAPGVTRVHYPGLPTHPDHALASRQMKGFGGVLSFEVEGGSEAAARVCDRLRWIARAPSLGGVESLVSSPLLSSHAMLSPQQRREAGIADGLLRLSVGVEDPEDLIADLRGALGAR
jgi:cystathionine gamma-synthase